MKNKSAKDLAFERERDKYKKRIKELEDVILELRNQLSEAEANVESLQEWNERLLEYTGMSDEDMRKVIQKDLDSAEVAKSLKALFRITGTFGSYI